MDAAGSGVPRIAVVGGGVSGLAMARFLHTATPAPEVTLIEAAPRLGGKIFTQPLAGLPVDTGPDAVLTRVPAMRALIDDLGLGDAVVPPAPSGVFLWSRGRLRRLPPGSLFGVPDKVIPLLRSGLLSPRGVLRAGLDVVLPRSEPPSEPTVAQLLQPRFGREVIDRLVDPLVGGVHAGSAYRLSASAAVPEIEGLVRGTRSVYLALRSRRKQAGPSGPVLVTFDGGLNRLVSALRASLDDGSVHTGTPVTRIVRNAEGFQLQLGPQTLDVDAVVLATPAYVTADLLESLAPQASALLREIEYVDVATVNLAYPRSAFPRRLAATGFLVPPCEGRLLIGCTWLSAKWEHLTNASSVLIRGMVGRVGDRRWMGLDDGSLVDEVHRELVAAMGLTEAPEQSLVQRWPQAIPQYTVGHTARVDRIEAALAQVPGVYLAGAAYRGAGIASCVAQAQRTATAVLDDLATFAATTGGPP